MEARRCLLQSFTLHPTAAELLRNHTARMHFPISGFDPVLCFLKYGLSAQSQITICPCICPCSSWKISSSSEEAFIQLLGAN